MARAAASSSGTEWSIHFFDWVEGVLFKRIGWKFMPHEFWRWAHKRGYVNYKLDRSRKDYHAAGLGPTFAMLDRLGITKKIEFVKPIGHWGHAHVWRRKVVSDRPNVDAVKRLDKKLRLQRKKKREEQKKRHKEWLGG